MENMQLDGKSTLIMLTLEGKSVAAVAMDIGKKDVQMETKIGGDGVMETVDQELTTLVVLKQP